MLYKVIGGLVVVLLLAVGGWIGAYLWIEAQKADSASGPGVSARLSDRPGGGGTVIGTGAGARRSASYGPDTLIEPGELLVADPPQAFATTASQMGFRILENVPLRFLGMRVMRVAVPRAMDEEEAVRQLAARFPGLRIDTHRAYETQGLKEYRSHTARPIAGWPQATDSCGGGIRLGQIDSPVDLSHPALVGQRIEFESFHRASRRPGPADHGTAVAAMLVGRPEWGGLLPGAELFAANMFEINESGRIVGSGLGLLKAVDWLAGKNVQVVNLSVAGGDNQVVRTAFDRARRKGLVLVAAAGNWGIEKPAFPAAYEDVIAVTAVDTQHHIYSKANRGAYIDFAATGVQVYGAVPTGGRIMSGTSFATPYLAVLMAMQIERGGVKSPEALRAALAKRVVDLGNPGKDKVFGYGMVDVRAECR